MDSAAGATPAGSASSRAEHEVRKFGWAAVLGALLAGWFGSGCSCGSPDTVSQAPSLAHTLEVDPTGEADYWIPFGEVALGDRRIETVEVKNGGSSSLRLVGEAVAHPFTFDLSTGVVEVGAAARLVFAFEPEEETEEPVEAIALLRTNEKGGEELRIRLEGRGREVALRCEPEPLDFGAVANGRQRSLRTLCTNPFPFPIEARIARLRGNHAASFSAALGEAAKGPVEIPPGESLAVDVGFRAQFAGKAEVTLELEDAFERRIAAIRLVAESVSGDVLLDPVDCLDFSYVGLGGSARRSLRLRSVAEHPITVAGVELHEPDGFSVRSETPIVLGTDGAPGEIEIEFHPASSGLHQTSIGLRLEDPVHGTSFLGACAKGFGGGPAITCNPAAIDFGMVALGMPVTRIFSCINSGAEIPGHPIDPLLIHGIRSTSDVFEAAIAGGGPEEGGYQLGESFTVEVSYLPEEERFDRGTILLETPAAPGGVHEIAVSGEGKELDPCQFIVRPPLLDFGVVDRGQERILPFRITNLGESACLINDLHLSRESDPAFSVEPISSRTIGGNESLLVEVRFAPGAYASPIVGAVDFQISSPEAPNQRVELRGTSVRPCLALEPASIDFGKVGPGCESREVRIGVSNICAAPVELRGIASADAADAELFQIRRRPTLPLLLHPRERAELSVIYAPDLAGSHRGSVAVEIEGGEIYLALLEGEAAPNPIQTDLFDATVRPKVDILWVMDNSTSFEHYQDRVAANLPAFLTTAESNGVDFRVAVTTSGLGLGSISCPGGAQGGEDGRFFPIDGSHPRILTPDTPDLETHWAHNMRVGTCHNAENYVEAAFRALSPPLINEAKDSRYRTPWNDGNAGFLRPEASLSIILVGDEPEQSTSYGKDLEDYLAFFRGLKGVNMLRIHAIAGSKASEHSSCGNNTGDRFHALLEATGGTWLDICTPAEDHAAWTAGLRQMSEGAFGFLSRFMLRGLPADGNGDGIVDEADIELRLDGTPQAPVSPSREQRWTYDPIDNAIDFTPRFVPKAGMQVTATYEVGCREH